MSDRQPQTYPDAALNAIRDALADARQRMGETGDIEWGILDFLSDAKYHPEQNAAIRAVFEASRRPDLAGLRALSDAATPGPWMSVGQTLSAGRHRIGDTQDVCCFGHSGQECTDDEMSDWADADVALIAAAVNYVRAALAGDLQAGATEPGTRGCPPGECRHCDRDREYAATSDVEPSPDLEAERLTAAIIAKFPEFRGRPDGQELYLTPGELAERILECLTPANPSPEPPHVHEWIDARNEVVASGEVCLCGAFRAGNRAEGGSP